MLLHFITVNATMRHRDIFYFYKCSSQTCSALPFNYYYSKCNALLFLSYFPFFTSPLVAPRFVRSLFCSHVFIAFCATVVLLPVKAHCMCLFFVPAPSSLLGSSVDGVNLNCFVRKPSDVSTKRRRYCLHEK